jgi:hypothetical protein
MPEGWLTMRRIFASVLLVLGLGFGGVLMGASPAAAHHTHSPTTACGSTVWYLNSHGYSYTWLSSWNHYDSTGHPIWAVCNFRDNRTFGLVKWCFRYYDHVIWRCNG